jgi:hypothetical protein
MNSDWQPYTILIGGAVIGVSLVLRKIAEPDTRVLRSWLLRSLALTALICGISIVLAWTGTAAAFHDPDTEALREPWSYKVAIQACVGFALILLWTLMASGIILGPGVLLVLAYRARKNLE